MDRNGHLCWVEVEWDAGSAPVSQDALLPPHHSASPAGQVLELQGWHQASSGGVSALPLTNVWPSASSLLTSLSPSLLSGHYPLSHQMKWHLAEQEAIYNGPK